MKFRNWVLLAFCALLSSAVLATPFVVQTQPVPRQEQNSRLIHALEQHNQALAANTRALQELTQQMRSQR